MNRYLFISSIILLAASDAFGQLTANIKSVEVGRVNRMAKNEIQIPILNQSHEGLSFSMISGYNNGFISLPDSLNPYELNYLTFSTEYISSKKKFNNEIVLESSLGRVTVSVQGQFVNSTANQECYDFNKKQTKVKTAVKYPSGAKFAPLIRIYSKQEKNTLYISNPEKVPYAHLVMLIDASGSMGSEDKLERIKEHVYSILGEMRPTDYISILRYSEGTEIIVNQKPCRNREEIITAIESIRPGGFTDGKNGIESAMDHTQRSQLTGYTNHIIVFTDGAFNLGSEQDEIEHYLLGQNTIINYKLSVMTIKSEKINDKEMKALSNSGNGYHFNLDKDSMSKLKINRILLKQLST